MNGSEPCNGVSAPSGAEPLPDHLRGREVSSTDPTKRLYIKSLGRLGGYPQGPVEDWWSRFTVEQQRAIIMASIVEVPRGIANVTILENPKVMVWFDGDIQVSIVQQDPPHGGETEERGEP